MQLLLLHIKLIRKKIIYDASLFTTIECKIIGTKPAIQTLKLSTIKNSM